MVCLYMLCDEDGIIRQGQIKPKEWAPSTLDKELQATKSTESERIGHGVASQQQNSN